MTDALARGRSKRMVAAAYAAASSSVPRAVVQRQAQQASRS
jgi:hypothetical protein